MHLFRRSTRVDIAAALVLVVPLASAGCSGQGGSYSGATGIVSGKVTVEGKPAPEGTTIAFVSGEGFSASGKVEADGHYTLVSSSTGSNQVPIGAYKVSVMPPSHDEMSPEEAMMAQQEGKKFVPDTTIPAKYQDPETSGIRETVKEGDNPIDLKLE